MTELGLPHVPTKVISRHEIAGPVSFTSGHHFTVDPRESIQQLAQQAVAPLSVILQVTKRCNFDCDFCSETLQLPDPTLDQLDTIRGNLGGVARVFLSGGEPLMRRDFGDVVDMYSEFILGIPTNATRAHQHVKRLVDKIAFVNIGLEGTRAITKRVRGDYDQVMAGVQVFREHGLPISLSAVVQRSTLHGLPFTYQIADVLNAGKLKLIMPLRKGNSLSLPEHEFINLEESADTFARLSELRATHDWRPALRMTAWTPETEGHMICVEPTGKANAWPVYDAPDLFEPLGNLLEEPVSEIWSRYRFKHNHFAKYLGKSIRITDHQEGAHV